MSLAQVARTSVKGITWPGIPTVPARLLLSLLHQLGKTQWWDPADIRRSQFRQMRTLLDHAYRTMPFYKHRLDEAGISPETVTDAAAWSELPILSRRDLQEQQLRSGDIPPGHGRVYLTQTSGSTGEPVKLYGTELTQLFWRVLTLRDHEWHERDFSGRLASIRAPGEAFKPKIQSDWGVPVNQIYDSGQAGALSLSTDISAQMQWLAEFDPHYILSFPSNLQALMDYSREHDIRLTSLREVRTISETVGPRLRETCRDTWGVPLNDVYSSQELGYIAIQCPERTCLHVQSENVYVEIIDDDGRPCKPGEVGRLVVTSLHNFATPLIRYELRDHAEAGDACACGRGLPVINRILGRERNMLKLPNGEMHWPLTGYQQYDEITPSINQFQFIQHTLTDIEVRLVVSNPLSQEEEEKLREHIRKSLGYPFAVNFSYVDSIPRARSGKFEEFISHVV